MAYADQQMSGNKVVAIIIVAIIHIALGYALISGLAYDAVQQVVERVTTVDVSEPPPPPPEDEPPPPPPDNAAPPPPVAPPPPISIAPRPPDIQTQVTIPPPRPPAVIVPPPAPVAAPAPPPPPPPPPQRANPVPRGNPGRWVSNDDYPSRAIREEAQGTVRFTLTVGPDGRASDCQVTGSSGNSSLDETACRLLRQRARFDPKLDSQGEPTTGTWSSSFRWVLQN